MVLHTTKDLNQLTTEEHEQLHNSPPDIAYDELERLIRDWIMEYEGYTKLFTPIMLELGVTKAELEAMEDVTELEITEERMDELHILYKAAEDRAYLIVIIKLYQRAVNWSPSDSYRRR